MSVLTDIADIFSARANIYTSVRGVYSKWSATLRAADKVIEAAECIKHWHDVELNNGDGMVVSADHVRLLWKALAEYKELNHD